MKTATTRRIEKKARYISRLITELRDDVIEAQDSNIVDVYRGYIWGTENPVIDRYLEFANRLDYSITGGEQVKF